MTLPNFIICGTQRGGTSSLYHYLNEHPEILMSSIKEVHYFDLNYNKGLDWYEKHFISSTSNYKAIGEASPLYMYLKEVPERIHEVLPDVKLIFILRNPVDRAYSHYWHEVKIGYEKLSFEEAIEIEKERLSNGDIISIRHYSYLDRGKYIEQIRRFKKYFSKDQMLILFTEELRENPEKVMKTLFEFLEVDPNFKSDLWYKKKANVGRRPRIKEIQSLRGKLHEIKTYHFPRLSIIIKPLIYGIDRINLIPGYPPMNPDTKERLLNYFKKYNEELEKELKQKITYWRQ
ncbi:sulfotransferase domain-containing protein [Thermococcus sp.]|uniref:sulfotransferase domain-containing protein n=1 Tax=Thermococcus sp. TaxID=35749 RepID=UPI002608CD09|nr:sulfotransferase domain-containing protein [Thermococcus sp.]MCD6143414.1 sulfotransferase domain-containing protein [Thermococcus sp.]